MTRLIPSILIGAATGGADAAARAIQDLPVSLGATATIAVFCASVCLWMGTQFAMRDKALAESRELLISRHQELAMRLERIEQKLEDLPCGGKKNECEPDKRK